MTSTSSTTQDVQPVDPSSDRLDRATIVVATIVVLGAMMSILDATAVNVAVNTLARDFHTPLATIQWVITGYTLTMATVIPLTGWGVDRFGTKRLYLASIVLFMLGSALCGMAWSAGSLITFRVLQGLGGGMLMPVGMTLLIRAAGLNRMGRVMSIIIMPIMVGPVLGPVLGGWLVGSVSWRWIFYINVPAAIAALITTMRVLPRDVSQPSQRLDWKGLVLLSPGLALLIFGLAKSSSSGGFTSSKVLVPVACSIVALGLFVVHALRATDPLIDLRLFSNRIFSAASVTLALVVISVFGGMLLLPLYLQVVRGETPMDTGLLLVPQAFGSMLSMRLTGRLADRIGAGRIVPFGLLTTFVGTLGLTQLRADTSYWLLGTMLFLLGAGMGATMMPTFTAAMQTLRFTAIARANTTLQILQQVSASLGTAVLSVLLVKSLAHQFHGGGSGGLGAVGQLPASTRQQLAAHMAAAFGATFWWALGFVTVAMLVAIAVLPRDKPSIEAELDIAVPEPAVVL